MESVDKSFGESHSAEIWDETLLIKSYNDCVKLVSEDIAKHVARSTNGNSTKIMVDSNVTSDVKVGAFVRATYEEDGCDYEAKIITVDEENGTCLLKYIGYDNEQKVNLQDLVSSWGKKSRRLQFDQAHKISNKCGKESIGKNKEIRLNSVPPPPPIPPMLAQNIDGSEHLSAMLMSWYMSGYYTGIYEGIKIANAKNY